MRRLVFFVLLVINILSYQALVCAEDARWLGVDETVVEKYAKEHGREAIAPLIDTDRGDLLLFVFLVAGAFGGFLGGYCWRMLTARDNSR